MNEPEIYNYENPNAVDQSLIAQSDAIGDFNFGPNIRLEGETQEQYHRRMKTQSRMMNIRMNHGIAAYNSAQNGQYKNPSKKQQKIEKAIRRQNRIRISRTDRRKMGLL